ncbi:MAG: LCP family protein [Chloroflexi bacterium]|nr:LCP family protein [Chloroflexota bacterium]
MSSDDTHKTDTHRKAPPQAEKTMLGGERTIRHEPIPAPPSPVVEVIGQGEPRATDSKKKKRRRQLPEWLPLVAAAMTFVGVIACAIVVGASVNGLRASNAFPDNMDIPTATPNATPDPDFLAPTVPAWQGTDRVTVLLLGADARPGETDRRPLTDSIMLLMLDPEENVASVLSLPRDLYVEVPGYGLQRINTAYVLGGGALAMETVEYNFGVRVDYFALVNFEAFITLVDEIGGVEVDVPAPINDPQYPAYCDSRTNCGYDPFYINAGLQVLDGETALKYARTRHGDNDFERARRQQQVLFAIRDKVVNPETFPTLVARAPTLYEAVRDSIVSDMNLDQMIQLASSAQQVERDDIRTGVIDASYTVRHFTEQGADVAIPNRARIGALLYEVFWQECIAGGCPHAGD